MSLVDHGGLGDCVYPKDAIGRHSHWCCLACVTNNERRSEFQLNQPTDEICIACGTRRWGLDGSKNSLEHLLCNSKSCMHINPVATEHCINKGCLKIMPGHRNYPRAVDSRGQRPHVMFVSWNQGNRWLCPMCGYKGDSTHKTCRKAGCQGDRDVNGIWVIQRPGR